MSNRITNMHSSFLQNTYNRFKMSQKDVTHKHTDAYILTLLTKLRKDAKRMEEELQKLNEGMDKLEGIILQNSTAKELTEVLRRSDDVRGAASIARSDDVRGAASIARPTASPMEIDLSRPPDGVAEDEAMEVGNCSFDFSEDGDEEDGDGGAPSRRGHGPRHVWTDEETDLLVKAIEVSKTGFPKEIKILEPRLKHISLRQISNKKQNLGLYKPKATTTKFSLVAREPIVISSSSDDDAAPRPPSAIIAIQDEDPEKGSKQTKEAAISKEAAIDLSDPFYDFLDDEHA